MICHAKPTPCEIKASHGVFFKERRRCKSYETRKWILEIFERKKRRGYVVSMHDVGVPGAFDYQYVLWQSCDLRAGDRIACLGNLSGVVQKYLSKTARESSVFKFLFGNRKAFSKNEEPLQRSQNPRLQKMSQVQKLFAPAQDQGESSCVLPLLHQSV